MPTHYVHPARVTRFRAFNIAAVGVWLVGTVWLVVIHPDLPTAIQPDRPIAALVMSVGGGVWLLVAGALRTIRGVDTPG